MFIIFCGIPACGKSTVRKTLIQELEKQNEDYKVLITDEISNRVYEKVFRFLTDNVGDATYLIVDATFYKERWRERVRTISEREGEKLLLIYLYCDLETSLRRNSEREKGKQVTEKAIKIIHKELEKPENLDLQFDTNRITPKEVPERILKELPISSSED